MIDAYMYSDAFINIYIDSLLLLQALVNIYIGTLLYLIQRRIC